MDDKNFTPKSRGEMAMFDKSNQHEIKKSMNEELES